MWGGWEGGTLPHRFIRELDLRPRKLAPFASEIRDRVRPRSIVAGSAKQLGLWLVGDLCVCLFFSFCGWVKVVLFPLAYTIENVGFIT